MRLIRYILSLFRKKNKLTFPNGSIIHFDKEESPIVNEMVRSGRIKKIKVKELEWNIIPHQPPPKIDDWVLIGLDKGEDVWHDGRSYIRRTMN